MSGDRPCGQKAVHGWLAAYGSTCKLSQLPCRAALLSRRRRVAARRCCHTRPLLRAAASRLAMPPWLLSSSAAPHTGRITARVGSVFNTSFQTDCRHDMYHNCVGFPTLLLFCGTIFKAIFQTGFSCRFSADSRRGRRSWAGVCALFLSPVSSCDFHTVIQRAISGR